MIFAAQAIADPPEVAEILEPAVGAKPLDPEDVHMVARFSDGDGDEHVCSDWEIWTVPPEPVEEPVWQALCAEGGTAVHIHLGDGEFVNSHEGRHSLLPDSSYELRVRFKDDSNPVDEEEWSEWETRPFTTREPGPVGSDSKTWEAREGYVVETFAEDLRLPTNIAMVPDPGEHPDDPYMYVTELYGNVKVITRDGTVSDYETELLNFDPLGGFPGSGEKGLTGIVVDPESGDVFVSMIHEDEDEEGVHRPKVVRLISAEDGMSAEGQEDVLYMDETRQGPSHQISNLTISPDGNLFVHNGDGFGQDELAPELDSFLGKVLRMTLDGDPLTDNPFYTDDGDDTAEDYVWAKGLRNPFGGGWRLSDGTHWLVGNGPSVDRLAKVNKGEDYRWPSDSRLSHGASYNWDPAHAPVNIEFVEEQRFGGSGFPDVSLGHAFVTESGPTWGTGPKELGKRVVEFDLGPNGELNRGPLTVVEYVGTGKASAVGLAAGDDGLYFTDLYKDKDYVSPVDRGANVLRIRCTGHCPLPDEPPPPPKPPAKPVVGPAPSVESFDVHPKVFAVGLGPRLRALKSRLARSSAVGRGTVFDYSLSERSRVWIGIRPLLTGWRLRGRGNCRLFSQQARERLRARAGLRRCVLRERRGVRRANGRGCRHGSWHRGRGRVKRVRCVLRGPRGVIRGPGEAGDNMRLYAGKLGNRWLRPGRYLGIVRARDLDNKPAQPRHAAFRVVSRRAR